MSAREIPEKFLVAFSFAGEQRDLVRSIAEVVEQQLGRGTVFYDEWFEHYLAGPASDDKLQKIYGQRSELVVVGVSGQYGSKPWTLAECDAVRARSMKLRASTNPADAHRILPLWVGEGDVGEVNVPGILFNTIAPDVRNRPLAATAQLIIDCLRLILPDTLSPIPVDPQSDQPKQIWSKGPVAANSKSPWDRTSYYNIDREPQIQTFGKHVESIGDRPFVLVWYGAFDARHDILRTRINRLKPKLGGHKLTPAPMFCKRDGVLLANLKKACSELLACGNEDELNLQPLLVGRDFANHLITIDVELEWTRDTINEIQAIAEWCQQLGTIASDRRFVVKVAVMIPKPDWSVWAFWRKAEDVFQRNCNLLASKVSTLPGVVVLQPLSDIELKHLQDWRDEMIKVHGTREDDYFGDSYLCQIVPHQTQRPMSYVADALDKIFRQSNGTHS